MLFLDTCLNLYLSGNICDSRFAPMAKLLSKTAQIIPHLKTARVYVKRWVDKQETDQNEESILAHSLNLRRTLQPLYGGQSGDRSQPPQQRQPTQTQMKIGPQHSTSDLVIP